MAFNAHELKYKYTKSFQLIVTLYNPNKKHPNNPDQHFQRSHMHLPQAHQLGLHSLNNAPIVCQLPLEHHFLPCLLGQPPQQCLIDLSHHLFDNLPFLDNLDHLLLWRLAGPHHDLLCEVFFGLFDPPFDDFLDQLLLFDDHLSLDHFLHLLDYLFLDDTLGQVGNFEEILTFTLQ